MSTSSAIGDRLSGWLALPLAVVGLALLLGEIGVTRGQAASSADSEFIRKAERLRQAVFRQPRAGATFDLWVRHHVDAGREADLGQLVDEQQRAAPNDPAPRLVRGLLAERRADWPAAIEAYRAAADLAPGDYYPHSRLAEVLLRQAQFNAAAAELTAALDRQPPRAECLSLTRQLGLLLRQLQRPADAVANYKRLAERFPDDARVLAEAAGQLQQLGASAAALELWQQVATAANDEETRFQARWQSAQLLRDTDDAAGALKALTALLDQVEPHSWRAVELQRAIDQTLRETQGEAGPLQFWQDRLAERPHDLAATQQVAEGLAAAGQTSQAITLYRQAIRRASGRRELQRGLVELLVRHTDFAAAAEQLRELAAIDPQDVEVWFELGQVQLLLPGAADTAAGSAVASWRHAVDLRPNDGAIARRAGELSRAAGINDAAEAFYREAVRRLATPENLSALGELLLATGRSAAAIETWQQLAADGSAAGWLAAAETMRQHGQLEAAQHAAESAVQREPDEPSAWRLLLDLQLARQAYADATNTVARMRALRRDDPEWQREVGQAEAATWIAAGRLEEPIERLRRRTGEQPDDVQAHWQLAMLLAAAGQQTAAVESFAQAAQRRPLDSNYLRQYAAALVRADRLEEAEVAYRRLLDLSAAASRDDYQRLIELQLRQGRTAEAAATAAMLIARAPRSAEAHLLQARVAEASGRPLDRLDALRQAVEIAPADQQALRPYVQALVDADRVSEALESAPRLLDAARTPAERLATLAWLLGWATGSDQHQRLEQLIRQRRLDDPAGADDWSRLLVYLLEQTGQSSRALEELSGLQARAPADLSLLGQLVDLAENTRQPARAVQYQQQIVRIDGSAAAREKLARLLRQAGQLEEAAEIWQSLIELPISPNESLALIDQLIRSDDFYAAQRLAEASVARHADNWRLVYRAGLLHLAMEQFSAARDTFEGLLQLPPSAAVDSPSTRRDLQPLLDGLAAERLLADIAERRQSLGPRHRRTLQQFAERELLEVGGADRLSAAQVFAAVACLRGLPGEVADRQRIEQLVREATSPEARSAIVAALWANRNYDAALQLATQWAGESAEAAALSHWLRVLTPPNEPQSADDPALSDSLNWLDQYRPDAVELIDRAGALRPNVQAERLLKRAASTLTASDRPSASAADLRRRLIQLAGLTNRALEQRLELAAGWLPHYLVAAESERAAANALSLSRGPSPLTELAKALARSLETAPASTDARARRLLQVLQADDSRVVLPDGTVQVIARAAAVAETIQPTALFPAPSRWLDRSALELLAAWAALASTDEFRQRLLAPLQAAHASTTLSADARRSLQFADLTLRWDWGESAAAIEQLVMLLNDAPDEAELQRLMVRARLELGDLDLGARLLNRLESTGDDRAELHFLRQQLWQRWTERSLWRELTAHEGAVLGLAVDRAGRYLASAGVDGRVRLWDVASDRLVRELTGHDDIVLAVAFAPDGMQLASAGYDRVIRRWRVEDGQPLPPMVGHTAAVRSLQYSDDGQSLISTSDDHTLIDWDTTSGAQRRQLNGHAGAVVTARLVGGRRIVSSSADRTLRSWNLASGQLLATVTTPAGAIRSLVPDGDHLIGGGDDRQISLWPLTDGTLDEHAQPRTIASLETQVLALALDLPRSRLAIGRADQLVQIWDLEESRELRMLAGHTSRVLALVWAPDGRWLASAGIDGVIKLWRIEPVGTRNLIQ